MVGLAGLISAGFFSFVKSLVPGVKRLTVLDGANIGWGD